MHRFELPGLEKDRDNFLHSCRSDNFTDQNGLVLPLLKYMKLHSKSSLMLSFICNSHSLPGFEPGALALESSALTMRPPGLRHFL